MFWCLSKLAGHDEVEDIRTNLAAFLVVTLHLHALPEIHQTLVDLACLGQSCASCLCVSRSFRALTSRSAIDNTYYIDINVPARSTMVSVLLFHLLCLDF